MAQFYSHLSYESDKDVSTTENHIFIIIQSIIKKGFIDSLSATMWYHTYRCAKNYRCVSDIYILSCLALELLLFSTERLVQLDMENMFLIVQMIETNGFLS